MADTIFDTIDLARDVKDFISYVSVNFDPQTLSDSIWKAKDDDFLRIRKKIGSAITIIGVIKIDDKFIRKALLGK